MFAGNANQAQAAFDAAQQQVAQADINLKRTQVRSPVNGYVTNLLMRVGDYAHAGATNISVIDADSYWIDGYFEETKMAHVCVGMRAEAALMGYRDPILGLVESVTRGISVSNAAPSTQGLPSVDPVYTWVRPGATSAGALQDYQCTGRGPARFGYDCYGDDPRPKRASDGGWLHRRFHLSLNRLSDVIYGPQRHPLRTPRRRTERLDRNSSCFSEQESWHALSKEDSPRKSQQLFAIVRV